MEVNNAPIISEFADGIKFRNYSRDELLLLSGKQFKILLGRRRKKLTLEFDRKNQSSFQS